MQNDTNSMFEQMFENSAIMTIFDKNNIVWFRAKDVCSILGYKEPANAIQYWVQNEDKIDWKLLKSMVGKIPSIKITYQTVFINESGVNSLVLNSKKPNAKKFQHWVTAEVLPQIRKHGIYQHKEHIPSALPHEDGYAYFSDKSAVNDDMREKFLAQPKTFKNRVEIQDIETVMTEMIRHKSVDFMDYDNEQVMYLYMTSIKNVNDDRLICKVGFTSDLLQRHMQLVDSDYKACFYIIGVKRCNRLSDESRFHRLFKKMYPDLNYKCKIGNSYKDELYYFDRDLLSFWDKFKIPPPECEVCEGNKLKIEITSDHNARLSTENQFLKVQLYLQKQYTLLEKAKNRQLRDKLEFEKTCQKINRIIQQI